jgi:ketosteroid isomerase-like protein
MPEENVEIIRQLVHAFNEGGLGSAQTLDFFDARAVFEEPPEQPGATVAEGRDEVRRLFGKFDEAWEQHRSEPTELRAIDEDRVLLLSIEHFRGRDGIEISQPSGTLFTLRNGKVVRMQSFWERENALESASQSGS